MYITEYVTLLKKIGKQKLGDKHAPGSSWV